VEGIDEVGDCGDEFVASKSGAFTHRESVRGQIKGVLDAKAP
jgi:hypothetical protein